jgi:hypothetical protein
MHDNRHSSNTPSRNFTGADRVDPRRRFQVKVVGHDGASPAQHRPLDRILSSRMLPGQLAHQQLLRIWLRPSIRFNPPRNVE